MTECGQKTCDEPAKFLTSWPGRDPLPGCEEHAHQAVSLGRFMGFHVPCVRFVVLSEIVAEVLADLVPAEAGEGEG